MARAAVIGVLWLCGCGSSAPLPVIQSVSPTQAPTNVPTAISVRFEPSFFPVTLDYGTRTASLNTQLALRIGGTDVGVEEVKAQGLTAVVPSGLPVGTHDVRVTLADGREGVLPSGFTVLPAPEEAFAVTILEPANIVAGQAFAVTLSRLGPDASLFQGTVTLSSGNKGQLLPRTSGPFTRGMRSESLTLDQPGRNWIVATDASGKMGVSASFNVRPRNQAGP